MKARRHAGDADMTGCDGDGQTVTTSFKRITYDHRYDHGRGFRVQCSDHDGVLAVATTDAVIGQRMIYVHWVTDIRWGLSRAYSRE